jgi:hypothetical protein
MRYEKEIEEFASFFAQDDVRVLHLNWALDAYWTKITKKVFIPELLTIYQKLFEKGITEDKYISWGDADGTLYYIPSKGKKVIVFTTQCIDYLFILQPMMAREYFPDAIELKDKFGKEYETHSIHIRRVWRPYKKGDIYNLKEIKQSVNAMLDSVETLEGFADDFSQFPQRPSIELYRKIDFNLDKYQESPRFYGDFRDAGYILSYKDKYSNGRVDGTQHSHTDLQILSETNLGCMLYEIENL